MTGFSIEALKAGIKKCDDNIVIFEEAIKKERSTQEYYRNLIKESKRMEEKRKLVKDGVKIKPE